MCQPLPLAVDSVQELSHKSSVYASGVCASVGASVGGCDVKSKIYTKQNDELKLEKEKQWRTVRWKISPIEIHCRANRNFDNFLQVKYFVSQLFKHCIFIVKSNYCHLEIQRQKNNNANMMSSRLWCAFFKLPSVMKPHSNTS